MVHGRKYYKESPNSTQEKLKSTMELNKLDSNNKTQRIVDSVSKGEEKLLYVNESVFDDPIDPRLQSRTEDESLYEEYGRESELYEEYLYEDDYAQYRFQSNINDNGKRVVTNAKSNEDSFFQKMAKNKWWLLLLIPVTLGGIAIGISIYLRKSPVSSASSTTSSTSIATAAVTSTLSTTSKSAPTSEPTTAPTKTSSVSLVTTAPSSTISSATTKTRAIKPAVLMLSTRKSSHSRNVPMVISQTEMKNSINFTYEPNTEVFGSCAATLDGEMLILGGSTEKRQISKVQDCKLARIDEMPFDFYEGGCNTFPFGIMLCFSAKTFHECHSFNGVSFKTETSSKFSHKVMALGSYRQSPFITGSYPVLLIPGVVDDRNGLKTEIYDYEGEKWKELDDYPYSDDMISDYATTNTKDSVYIFGGCINTLITNIDDIFEAPCFDRSFIIAQYKDDKWEKAGRLRQSRTGHGAITVQGITMIIGGQRGNSFGLLPSITNTEIWNFKSKKTKIIDQILAERYTDGLGLFLVETGFCNKD